jgi:hypothetical protein
VGAQATPHLTSSSSSGSPIVGAQRTFSRRRCIDILDLTSQVNDLDIHIGDIQNTLNTHVECFAAFQEQVDTQFNTINTTLETSTQTYKLTSALRAWGRSSPREVTCILSVSLSLFLYYAFFYKNLNMIKEQKYFLLS